MLDTMLDQFIKGYIACMLWSTNDDNEDPLDANYSKDDIAEEAMKKIVKDCRDFYEHNQAELIIYCMEVTEGDGNHWGTAGHDFWVTRAGHGCGYWDRDGVNENTATLLTDAARAVGDPEPYVGDDNKIYFCQM